MNAVEITKLEQDFFNVYFYIKYCITDHCMHINQRTVGSRLPYGVQTLDLGLVDLMQDEILPQ